MKVIKVLLLCLVMSPACLFAQVAEFNDFIPIGPAPIDFKIFDGRLFSEMTMDESNNEQVINLLPNELTQKSIIMIDKSGKMSFSPIELSEKNSTYIIKTDYIKYTTLPVRKDSESGEVVGVARVGIGYRIEATVRTNKKKITVSDLYSLGDRVRDGDLSGHITVSVMGIESEEVTYGFPVNAEITHTSISNTIQAQAIIKNAIYDVHSHLTPQVLQIKYTSEYRNAASNLMDLSMPILLPNRGSECVVIK